MTLREFAARLLAASDRAGIVGPAALAAVLILAGAALILASFADRNPGDRP